MDKFEVGETALVAMIPKNTENVHHVAIGDEVTVVGEYRIRTFRTGKRHWCYLVSLGDGHSYRARRQWLRKKPPKTQLREQLGEWELCPWQPKQLTVDGAQ
jgi:hypothetical protein